jgi:hypothetical protein
MLAEDDLVSDGYYTMCQNGKWGLMESDGTVLLPCRADYPVRRCAGDTLKWHYVVSDSDENWQAYNDTLAAANAGKLCSGEHDCLLLAWTYDINSGKVSKSAGMLVRNRWVPWMQCAANISPASAANGWTATATPIIIIMK